MTARRGPVNELCFAAEGMAATAAAASLRRIGDLARAAPAGRLFEAISTLTETSAHATRTLEEGHGAMQAGDDRGATMKFARALTQLDDLASMASSESRTDGQPAYLRKAR